MFELKIAEDGPICEKEKICLYDIASGSKISVLEGHRKGVWTVKFSPTDQILACKGHWLGLTTGMYPSIGWLSELISQ